MPKWDIPVFWSEWGIIEVEAEDLEAAKVKAICECELPQESEYLDDSLEIDIDALAEFYNPLGG